MTQPRQFHDRVPSAKEVIDLISAQRRGRGPSDGHALSLSETAVGMYMRGHFDQVPTPRVILELEKSALAKLKKGLKPS